MPTFLGRIDRSMASPLHAALVQTCFAPLRRRRTPKFHGVCAELFPLIVLQPYGQLSRNLVKNLLSKSCVSQQKCGPRPLYPEAAVLAPLTV